MSSLNSSMLKMSAVLIERNHRQIVEAKRTIMELSRENGLMLQGGYDLIELIRREQVAREEYEMADADAYTDRQEFQYQAGVDDDDAIEYLRTREGGELTVVSPEEATAILYARTGCYIAVSVEERKVIEEYRKNGRENAKRRESRKQRQALGKGLEDIERERREAKKKRS